eukprot:2910219-Prymnesium_polylepis.1
MCIRDRWRVVRRVVRRVREYLRGGWLERVLDGGWRVVDGAAHPPKAEGSAWRRAEVKGWRREAGGLAGGLEGGGRRRVGGVGAYAPAKGREVGRA